MLHIGGLHLSAAKIFKANNARVLLTHHSTGGLDSSGREWKFVDTLPMARSTVDFGMRRGKGSHTLPRLYKDCMDKELEGAHTALVDAMALCHVWRWLVTDLGGGGMMAVPRDRRLTAHLQTTGYPDEAESQVLQAADKRVRARAMSEARLKRQAGEGRRNKSASASDATTAAVKAAKPAKKSAAAAAKLEPLALDPNAPVSAVPGVGKWMESRLKSKGMATVGALDRLFRVTCQGNKAQLRLELMDMGIKTGHAAGMSKLVNRVEAGLCTRTE